MAEFVDFKEIMEKVPFDVLFNHLDIPFTRKGDELKGEGFIANLKKKQYFNPKGDGKGSVINYLANHQGITPREAGIVLKKLFLTEHQPKRKIPELTLTYTQNVEKLGITEQSAKLFEVGEVKQRSIMAGKIAFKVPGGYIGKEVKKDGWFYPKGFRRSFLYNHHRVTGDFGIIVNSPIDCIRLYQVGIRPVVATMGLAVTQEQKQILSGFRKVFYITNRPDLSITEITFVKTADFTITPETSREEIVELFKQ